MKQVAESMFLKVHQKLPTISNEGQGAEAKQVVIYNIGGPGAKAYKLYFYTGSAWELVTSS